ncbi:MAG: hypothetical protein HC866_05620 [Leptolyngbyaceae cyanobacterium RU_5_1]|nr:hypothetical protein [Leptolyngbyaceae cyanobacterium RU_5_1]
MALEVGNSAVGRAVVIPVDGSSSYPRDRVVIEPATSDPPISRVINKLMPKLAAKAIVPKSNQGFSIDGCLP